MEEDDRRYNAGDSLIKAGRDPVDGVGNIALMKRQGALVIREGAVPLPQKKSMWNGKVRLFHTWKNSVINENSQPLVNKNVPSNINNADKSNAVNASVDLPKSTIYNGPWSRKPYINLDFKVDDLILSDDGKAVKMNSELEEANANKLSKSLVLKVFGKDTPPQMVAWELRKQWKQFGQFHFTILGGGWFLCSFSSEEMVKAVLSGGPWFVNDHIIGMEKWTLEFNSSSTKGLSSPIWVRLPNLPLQCWDEKNVACIASRVGIPLMLDGNMFNWGRREFARICIGHVDKNCVKPKDLLKEVEVEGDFAIAGKSNRELEHSTSEVSYGPWILVNNRKKNFFKHNNKWINPNYVKPMKKTDTEVAIKDKSLSDITKEVSQAVTEFFNSFNLQVEEGDICNSGFYQDNNTVGKGCLQTQKTMNKDDISSDINTSLKENPVIEEVKFNLQKELRSLGNVSLKSKTRKGDSKIICSGGARKVVASLYLKEVKENDALFVGIMETKISSMEPTEIKKFIGEWWDFFLYPASGLSEGILVCWRQDLAVFEVTDANEQMVIGKLKIKNHHTWMIASIYGSRNCNKRKELWHDLGNYFNNDLPWIIGGDFNCIISQDDKRGGRKFIHSQGTLDMISFMNRGDLHEVGYLGPKYTWWNNKDGRGRIFERLDRCLINSAALNLLQSTVVKHLPRIASDHCPIAIKILESKITKSKKFVFEDIWLSYKASYSIVSAAWNKKSNGSASSILNSKFNRALRSLFFWNKEKHKNLFELKQKLKMEIIELQSAEISLGGLSDIKLRILRTKIAEFNNTLGRLSMWWRQRAKIHWMNEGDINSKFFHAYASSRRNSNKINGIKNEEGIFCEDKHIIEDIFLKYFNNKWKFRHCSLNGWPAPAYQLNIEERNVLSKEFTFNELEESDGSYGMHFVSWSNMCKPKDKGGYGVQSLVEKLGPLRAKHAHNFIMKPDTLLNRVLRARYGDVLWNGIYCNNPSSTWKIIQNGAESLFPVLRWSISNGEYVDTFKDIWILDKTLDKWPTFVSIIENEYSQVFKLLEEWNFGTPEFNSVDACYQVLSRLANINPFLGNLICSAIFYCWKSRNQLVHGGCDDSCYVIAYRAVIQYISSFKSGLIRENWDANQLFKLSKSSWLPPPPGWIKVNVDASIFLNNSTGIGGIFRECKGRSLAAFGFHTIHWDIAQMELLAILSLRDLIKDWILEARGIVIEAIKHKLVTFSSFSVSNESKVEFAQKALWNFFLSFYLLVSPLPSPC
ncbi:hypothetical protein KFK09_026503 [Dendrobium nobile]|uniref:DUF4283 domain-containing protein n=1 Tax=Dendrobium nobile TaxID=94219 RepID=A0A8T3A8B3_DENNO|nr:hypothetical protein KFK09_026503 [Dendrobium nobile]